MTEEISVFTDGSSISEYDPTQRKMTNKQAGWAWALWNKPKQEINDEEPPLLTASGNRYGSTNNQMEAFAMAQALETFEHYPGKLCIYADSELAIRWATGQYQYRPTKTETSESYYFRQQAISRSILALNRRQENNLETEIIHVAGHAGLWPNECVDKLAKEAGSTNTSETQKQQDDYKKTAISYQEAKMAMEKETDTENPSTSITEKNNPQEEPIEEILRKIFLQINPVEKNPELMEKIEKNQNNKTTVSLVIKEEVFQKTLWSQIAEKLKESGYQHVNISRQIHDGDKIWSGYRLQDPSSGPSIEKRPSSLRKKKRMVAVEITASPIPPKHTLSKKG